MEVVGCDDCGLPYSDAGFVDLVVPHDVWAKISPTGDAGGLLCPTCLARAVVAADLSDIKLLHFGPFTVQE